MHQISTSACAQSRASLKYFPVKVYSLLLLLLLPNVSCTQKMNFIQIQPCRTKWPKEKMMARTQIVSIMQPAVSNQRQSGVKKRATNVHLGTYVCAMEAYIQCTDPAPSPCNYRTKWRNSTIWKRILFLANIINNNRQKYLITMRSEFRSRAFCNWPPMWKWP